jgi:hypothetical protein
MVDSVSFGSGTKLMEIGEGAFGNTDVKAFTLPSSIETMGDRCFEKCTLQATIAFEEISRLNGIGEQTLADCALTSITVSASVEEIDGSAFVRCPIQEIRVAAGSRTFAVQGFLTIGDGTQIVRYFGFLHRVMVPMNAELLRKSCFEYCRRLLRIAFEAGSKLREIGPCAICDCASLTGIEIPPSVEVIHEAAFKRGTGLECCSSVHGSSSLRTEKQAFAFCRVLKAFCLRRRLEGMGEQWFRKCVSLCVVGFACRECLKKIVGELALDEALEHIGLNQISSLFRIEICKIGIESDFAGWVSVVDNTGHLTLVRDF